MRPLRVVTLVVGIVFGFVAFGLVAGGASLVWAHGALRDGDGYYTFDARPLGSPGYAVTSEDLDLADLPDAWLPSGLATVRIGAASEDDVFVGIAPRDDVERYLGGVTHSVVNTVEGDPFRVTTRQVVGTAAPAPPAEQGFWSASASGAGAQALTWEPQRGDWTIVVMNADASDGVDVRLSAGVKTGLLLPIGVGLLLLGLLVAAGATTLIVLSARVGDDGTTSVPAAPLTA